jgi:hypothetical protein
MHRDMFYMSDNLHATKFHKKTIGLFKYPTKQETYTYLQSHEEESGFVSSTWPTHISPYFTN